MVEFDRNPLAWLDFVFDERWSIDHENIDAYLDRADLEIEIDDFARDCIKVFKNPEVLVDRFCSEEIDSGFFSFILSPRMELCWWLWDPESDPVLRREFISSAVTVFEKVFTKVPTRHSCFMWWDSLRDFSENPDSQTSDWIFDALSRILALDSYDCQVSALHGLGHLNHDAKRELIENFLLRNPDFGDRDYAMAAMEGRVL